MAVILLVSCGVMGAALGRLLTLSGHTVIFPAHGRSEATRKRATEAGITALELTHQQVWSDYPQANSISLVLSILPPSEALSFASEFCETATRALKQGPEEEEGSTATRKIFVDLNAIGPDASDKIASLVGEVSGWAYVEGSIIGMPPRYLDETRPSLDQLVHNPCVYLSVPPTTQEAELDQVASFLKAASWKVRVLNSSSSTTTASTSSSPASASPRTGASKALKLCYSSIAKGSMLLCTSAALSAASFSDSTSEALATELSESLPGFATFFGNQMQHVMPKSTRFVEEMRQIAQLVPHAPTPVPAHVSAPAPSSAPAEQLDQLWNSVADVYLALGSRNGTHDAELLDSQLRAFGDTLKRKLIERRLSEQEQN
ncbi:hypothetical protein BCV70DRAFT_58591 [Testicularia cyperi]|uniref:Phosphogluconate dehydrogenase NAD-binding putative C-terminal domain-containing protein n=1 Tax=Testicularia cyperi TaxID=1882483 RepID=A0A317XXV3_9BASI|nr:hypothetical protein BCV70DRAFT_58591 [Testicularia cyperi]